MDQKPEGGAQNNRLGQLGQDIYSRDFPDISNYPKPKLAGDDSSGPRRWQGTEEMFSDTNERPGRHFPFKAVFIGAVAFFLLCLGIAGIVVYRGFNTVSASAVDISFLGPVSIAAGSNLDFSVVVQNNNPGPIQNAMLYLDYPSGATEATDTSAAFTHETVALNTIDSGASATHDVRMVLYGAEHSVGEVTATLQYSIPNNNGVFKKEQVYDVQISSAPLLLNVNAPSQTPAGAPVTFTLSLSANSTNPPQNVLVTAQYPFGFQFASSTPTPVYSNSEWLFPSIAASSTQTISVTGYLQGQENDQQTVRFLVGTQSANDPKTLGIIYLAANQTLLIQRSPLALAFSLNNSGGTAVVSPGLGNGTLTVTNNLPVSLLNTQISVQVGGNALDPGSVNAGENGLYRQTTQTLSWDRLSVPALGQLNPGQQVSLDFAFNTLSADLLAALQNGSITFSASASGQQLGATSDAAPVTATAQASARLASAVGLLARAVYSTGPFTNTGSVPPRVDQPTTYTVVWTLTNSSNIVSGGTVTASLPPYVHWLGQISPASAAVTFDATRNVITWKPGDLPAGGAAPVASVAFQIQVTPMASQVGTAPDTVENIGFTGTDAFVNVPVTTPGSTLTTAVPSDPTYGNSNGFVQ